MPRSGRSSSSSSTNISAGRARASGGTGPCSWSAISSRRSTASRAPTRSASGEAREQFRRRARRAVARRRSSAATEFRDLSIAASFRSAQPVLDVVDAVIDDGRARGNGLGRAAAAASRAPSRARRAGRAVAAVRGPRIEDDGDEGEECWVACAPGNMPRRWPSASAQMVDEAPVLASTERPLTPGDILVLVRSRGELASLIVARLFAAGVPVAGVDRLHLHEPLAVQDLLAAVKFAVQPNDDLSLACLLVSPLIGWDQDQLRDARLRPQGQLVARASASGQARAPLSSGPRHAGRAAADRRLHDAGAFPRNDPVRADAGPAQALRRGSAWRRATRSTSW